MMYYGVMNRLPDIYYDICHEVAIFATQTGLKRVRNNRWFLSYQFGEDKC